MAERATLKDWFLLTRPWSVTAPLVPFLVGAGFVIGSARMPGFEGWLRWGLGLASGLLLLLACNLFNTWGDERSGVDRVPGAFLTTPQIQQGKITLRQTFVFGTVLFLLAGAIGCPTLFFRVKSGGWQFDWVLFVTATIGFLGAVNYSTGIKYKYLGLGVPGVAFLEGTLYLVVVEALLEPGALARLLAGLRTGEVAGGWSTVLGFLVYTLPVAALVGVILHGNDMRDIATDMRAGVGSLAGMLGPRGALSVFWTLHLLPYAIVTGWVAQAVCAGRGVPVVGARMLPLLALPLASRLIAHAVRDWKANPAAPAWLGLEKGSGGVHFLFGVLYAVAWALGA